MKKAVCLGLAAACVAAAQAPKISVIDFFGVRRVPQARLLQALGAVVGDPLPPSKEDAEQRLAEVDGVALASLEAVCCEAEGAVLFVGIEEKGAPHFDFRSTPTGAAVLPDDIVAAYHDFVEQYEQAARASGNPSQVYAASKDPVMRAQQERFTAFADKNLALLRQVIEESSDAEQRAIAACVAGFAQDRQAAIDALQIALRDPAPAVRRTALSALHALAMYAAAHPDAGLKISPTWLIEMLNSVVWADRVRAADVLVTLTGAREPGTLSQLRERALDSLVEMARWNSLPHALPAYILAGRVAGASDEEIRESWDNGETDKILSRLPSSGKRAAERR
jgi:hypothetical protein